MRRTSVVLACVVLSTAGCGEDEHLAPDAAPPVTICGAPAATISAFPGSYAGSTLGAGADLGVAEGACADERFYAGASGEDQVIDVVGMTPGATYVVELETSEDLGFYVAGTCDPDGPATGACLLYVDQSFGREHGELIAPASGQVAVIVDSADDPGPPATGGYTLTVRAAECVPEDDTLVCTDPDRLICSDFRCVECADGFGCAGATPACDPTGACVASLDACTGDDAGEPDDGPTDAATLAVPTAVAPTVVTAAVCSLGGEADWYALTLGARGSIRFEVAWTDAAADLRVDIHDSAGVRLGTGATIADDTEAVVVDLPAGSYLIAVGVEAPAGVAAATPYTLTVSRPECLDDLGCGPARPVCTVGICEPGPDDCTGDDAGDSGLGDDGPAGARSLTGPVGTPTAITAAACNTPGSEADWYAVTVADGQGLTIDVAFAANRDFDVAIFDDTLALYGMSFWLAPELVTLTYLPAGTYYIRVLRFVDPAVTAAAAYTITATRTVAQTCATRADCAAEHATQLYRGTCAASGACIAIAPGTRLDGAACDSGDDCLSAQCSYTAFEADAQASICTIACNLTADCDVLGAGLTCTTGFANDLCVPACTDAIDCGARPTSSTLDPGEPWDYFVCTPATGVCSPT